MSVVRKSKKQYIEHYEEHVGEEMAPYVALLEKENQEKTNAQQQQTADGGFVDPVKSSNVRKKVRFWRRLAALFS